MWSKEWFIDNVRKHQARLRASIRALGVRAEAVDDIAQDVFVLTWQKLADFDSGDFGAWLVQIARRLIANERRKEAGRRRILAGEFTDFMLRSLSEAKGPAEHLVQVEEINALQSCLERLPPKGRQMIQQFFVHNNGGLDSRLHTVELTAGGEDLRLTLQRIRGKYALTIESLTSGTSSTLSNYHPDFLDGERNLYVGVFAAVLWRKWPEALYVKEFKATVWTLTPQSKNGGRAN